MLKKAKAAAGGEAGLGAKDLSERILESSRQIWLAGLGAFSRAQAEGVKMFDTLVRQGEVLETRTRRAAVDKATAAREGARARAKEMQAMAGGTWDKLEQVFEKRVERALSKLGVHTQNDVQRLTERVEELSIAVNELIRKTGADARGPRAARRGMRGQATGPGSAVRTKGKSAKTRNRAATKAEPAGEAAHGARVEAQAAAEASGTTKPRKRSARAKPASEA